ncbi:MAG TPA: DnaJ domain-containing protein, partial [Candidatus Udaeobacter sp.]|nr:DnaJ domain-containing protein [Candidatus Udaeobacter sp.]
YELLDLSEDATPEQIEKAYKRAASKHHPDKNIGNEAAAAELFKEAKEAYECLIDPERRKVYDETGDTTLETGNPAEDLFMHLLNEIVEHFETSTEVLMKCRSVIEEMLDECSERKLQTDRRIVTTKSMIAALRFKGKGTNFLEGVLNDKIKKLEGDRQELDDATVAAKGVWDLLKDYEATDRPYSNSPFETAESLRIKAIESMMKGVFGSQTNQTGKRRGGMPFSGV